MLLLHISLIWSDTSTSNETVVITISFDRSGNWLDLLQESPDFVSGERQRVAEGFGMHGHFEFPIHHENEDIAVGWMFYHHHGAARAYRNSRKLNQAFERLAYKSICLVSYEWCTVLDLIPLSTTSHRHLFPR